MAGQMIRASRLFVVRQSIRGGQMCTQTPPATAVFAMDVRAPGRARQFVAAAFCSMHASGVLDEAELLVSELVTNAVRYGTPPIWLRVECDDSHEMVVRVADADPAPPTLMEADWADESGRGLALVDVISDDWGVESLPEGKQVWFRLKT
jgi:anti-sigma regulatory factor (Ser/Thr protein kinase)